MSPRGARRLIGGVGYANLRDGSAGPLLVERLAGARLLDTDVEDLSYSAIDVLFLLQRRRYEELVLVGSVARGDAPGTVRVRRWDGRPESADALQGRVAEAVQGVISLENLLRIAAHFGALPPDVTVVEIEPADETWGPETSAPVTAAIARVEGLIAGQAA